MKIKMLNGILIVDILSILLIVSIVFIPSTMARVILGLPFLLFFPGYTLVATLFVNSEGMDNIGRMALSGAMSIAVVALIGFGLNYTPWGIKLEPVLYSISAFILVTSVIALVRRARILKTNRITTEFIVKLPSWGDSTFNKSFSIILIILIFSALGVLGYTIAVPRIGERFTEFYILGADGKAQDYPTQYTLKDGQIIQVVYGDGTVDAISGLGKVTMGIVNHEHKTEVYYVKMTIDGEPVRISIGGTPMDTLDIVKLQPGEKWEKEIGIIPQHTGDAQKVELLLYKDGETTSTNSLQLSVNVKPSE